MEGGGYDEKDLVRPQVWRGEDTTRRILSGHRYGGGRIANSAQPAWKCRSRQKLLPVKVRKL